MSRDGPNWEGLLKWSLANSDGTNSSRNLSEEDRRWFMEAMQAQTVDVVKRMKEITLVMRTPEQVLESQGVTPQDIEDMLDELHEHVESIDMANDLHSIGGLVPLIDYLRNSHANIRAKAAEVVSTIVQNNPRSQQLVMEANGLEPLLLNFTSDGDVTVRTKALGAISSLIRHNKPGVTAFRLANGYGALKDALSYENVRLQRKALNLIHYLLTTSPSDHAPIAELGFPRIFIHLASGEDGNVREASLRCLLELAQNRPAVKPDSSPTEEDEKLKQILRERVKGIGEMSVEDLGAAREESQLVGSLWNIFNDGPCPLRENMLLAAHAREDGLPPPDVAGHCFEPPLRAWAANGGGEKTVAAPLMIGPGPGPSGGASS